MTPQLFINYKLKSVAHIPINAMIYKTLNTFIDDMFSFVIKMPVLLRIACFRDDVIFFIYLYQMWIYPVDKTRKNEYGYSAVDLQKVFWENKVLCVSGADFADMERNFVRIRLPKMEDFPILLEAVQRIHNGDSDKNKNPQG